MRSKTTSEFVTPSISRVFTTPSKPLMTVDLALIPHLPCGVTTCHHCGTCYVEFFPNARQENLFIGMVHAFMVMGVPEYVLTDNMRSVRRSGAPRSSRTRRS